jgi:hypothetical protein
MIKAMIKLACGCRVAESVYGLWELVFCPMHQATPALLAAARYTLQNLDAAAHEGLITCPANFQVQLNESARLLREALADAEP